ncbi:AzlC family ABC transporter permease [Paenibacillus thermotolerans]|uniref:AzlC family ABC transporter permease n=1 Tax=Paenibacillus thermotolerans TaxID=3027807 RepID=UPI002367E525|nr:MULTISPECIES: AzlC family ABC transporter permease [unclassified Paenibacillus]
MQHNPVEATNATAASPAGTDKPLREGMKAGAVIGLGYIPIAIAFGLLANASGIEWWHTAAMSLLIYAGASQFVGANMIALGFAAWEIVTTTFILNLRHFLMSTTLSQRIERNTSRGMLGLIAFGITDETFSVASLRKEQRLQPKLLLGLNFVAYASWNAGTWLGMALGTALPASLQSSMGISLYAMFIGLLVPSLRKARPAIAVTGVSVTVASALHWLPLFAGLSSGWVIMISTVLASAAGALLFKEKSEKDEPTP